MSDFIYDKNAKMINIPVGTKTIPDEAFLDNNTLEEVIIPDSVEYIGMTAFKGCKNLKKVKLPNSLKHLESFAFCECESLEEINIPSSLHYFSKGVFSYCYNLTNINCHDNINYIDDLAFYNCKKLTNFDIPKSAKSIGRMALLGCERIKKITIPKVTDCIEVGALSLMSSLEEIVVEDGNKKYFTADNNTVLINKDGVILQYAINSNRDEFIVGYYTEDYGDYTDNEDITHELESDSLIYNIADFAFAGATKLKKMYIASEIQGIGRCTFMDCDNLKDLEIFHTNYGDSFLLSIYNNLNEDAFIPFENIVVGEGIKTLCENLDEFFKNAKNIILPESLEHISPQVFSKSKHLKELKLPKKLKMISPKTFYPETNLLLEDFGYMKAKDFNMLQTKTNSDYYINKFDKDNVRIFSLNDGTYYVKIDDYDMVKINRDEIINLSKSSKTLANHPDEFIRYLVDLLIINADYNNLITNICINPDLKNTFSSFLNDYTYVQEIANKKVSRAIQDIFKTNGIYDEVLFSNIMVRKFNKEELIKILTNFNNPLIRFFRLSKVSENIGVIINVDKLIKYCELLEKYQRYDKFLYNNPVFFEKLDYENQELLIKHFNKNLKHLLNNSHTLNDYYGNNLNDLFKLCKILGVFSDNEILSQKAMMFITEKMFDEKAKLTITGDTIHSIFGGLSPKDNINYEFIPFFMENYNELIELEKSKAGIISRIYNTFLDIQKTATSHKGEQRQLKVTLDKCLDYFLAERFEGVNENNKDLARLLQKYYSESYALKIGEMVIEQSKHAPRNIFSKINYDSLGNTIYSYDESEDLIENIDNDFFYEWLPKQDYDNLILGKYCNCCAHLIGEGRGIMRASMILDNCQNLVIRNLDKIIIAKMTIYVNREKGYAVFNTAEVNINHRAYKDSICKVFLRGVQAFVERYNSNNTIPITLVTIGDYRNNIKDELGNIETSLLDTPNYSDYSYYIEDKNISSYDGDSKARQILVLKK